MKRIVILGNGGSGKSYLGEELSGKIECNYISLDDLFWEPGGFNIKRSPEHVDADIDRHKVQDSWVVEGVFGGLAEKFIPYSDLLIVLSIEWEVCKASMLSRSKPGQTESSLAELVTWCSEYYSRENKNSLKHHELLFNEFKRQKMKFSTRQDVNSWLTSINKKLLV
ncbi:hypothetical protein KO489_01325 [Reinekea forsetii]|nr:hypothetical protein [Reinekea forsetii]